MQKRRTMKPTHELPALASIHLAAVHGGRDDAASKAWNGIKQNFHDWRMRTGQAATDLATRNPKGYVTNSIAATYNLASIGLAPANEIAGHVGKK